MTLTETSDITRALRVWAEHHPYRDEPVLLIAGETYSPRELAREVEAQTPVGLLQLRVFQHAIEQGEETLPGILQALESARSKG
jgi:hypothetical protein